MREGGSRRIPFCVRSVFLETLLTSLTSRWDALIKGEMILIELGKRGGYSGKHQLRIDRDSSQEFTCESFRGDPSRFPARIKAAARALYDLGGSGEFIVTHEDGLMSVQAVHARPPSQLIATEFIATEFIDAEFIAAEFIGAKLIRDRNWRAERLLAEPAVYQWWGPVTVAERLKVPIQGCTQSPRGDVLLYVGIANSLRERLHWHVCQNHTPSAIRSGFLSTLRFTLSALLGESLIKMDELNTLIDHLTVSFEYCPSREAALELERRLMHQHALPLNIQGNKHPFIRKLKSLRAECKKRSLLELN